MGSKSENPIIPPRDPPRHRVAVGTGIIRRTLQRRQRFIEQQTFGELPPPEQRLGTRAHPAELGLHQQLPRILIRRADLRLAQLHRARSREPELPGPHFARTPRQNTSASQVNQRTSSIRIFTPAA